MYDSTAYLAAMKQFQRDTKGMLPNSPEWNKIRNEIYAELRRTKQSEIENQRDQSGQTASAGATVDYSSFYNLLIVDHADLDSYETLHTLNYFGFPINVEEEDYFGSSRKMFDFSKSDEYPFLVINSSHEEMPGCDLAGRENILSFLFNNSLIGAYRSYGVYEQQGLDWVDTTLGPAVDELLTDWRTLAQFHMRPKHFKQGKMSIEGHTNIKLYCLKFLLFLQTKMTQEGSSLTRQEKYEQIQTVLDQFVDRIAVQDGKMFHGGEAPDAADFRAFAMLNRVAHTFMVIQVMDDREDRTLSDWYSAMKRLCQPKLQF